MNVNVFETAAVNKYKQAAYVETREWNCKITSWLQLQARKKESGCLKFQKNFARECSDAITKRNSIGNIRLPTASICMCV